MFRLPAEASEMRKSSPSDYDDWQGNSRARRKCGRYREMLWIRERAVRVTKGMLHLGGASIRDWPSEKRMCGNLIDQLPHSSGKE
jgi:hypothetical protein